MASNTPFYVSPLTSSYILEKQEFLSINETLDRSSLTDWVAANLADPDRENKAIVVQGNLGTGRTTFAINAAVHFAPANTCVHYFPQSCLQTKSFQSSLIECPAVPISCLWNPQHASLAAKAFHVVIVDDVIDLKHFAEIKSIVSKLDAAGASSREKEKQVFYFFIVDHAESRPLSARMQKKLSYVHLLPPTDSQCRRLLEQTRVFPKYSFSNLTTLFAAIRTFQQDDNRPRRRHFPYLTTQVSVDHEKDALFQILQQVFTQKRAFSFKDQQRVLQSSLDAKNVGHHYLENLPSLLDAQHREMLSHREKHQLYLETLRCAAKHDFHEAALNQPGRNWTGHAESTQQELVQYFRLAALVNIAAKYLQGKPGEGVLHVQEPRALEFTKLNTKFSMQQSEKWFMTLVSLRLHVYNIATCISNCMQRHANGEKAPLESESSEMWRVYLSGHPFFKDKLQVLCTNDIRHLFRFLHMQIGALTIQANRMQLEERVWLDRTYSFLGCNSASKKQRRKRLAQET